MNENCTCKEKTLNANVNVNTPKQNVSTGNFHFEVEELNYGGISLKGLKGHIGSTITDENVRIQADFAGKLFGQLIAKFGDALVDNIKVNTERQRQRIKDADREFEAAHKYDEAREKRAQEDHAAEMKLKETHAKYHESQIKVQEAELKKIKNNN